MNYGDLNYAQVSTDGGVFDLTRFLRLIEYPFDSERNGWYETGSQKLGTVESFRKIPILDCESCLSSARLLSQSKAVHSCPDHIRYVFRSSPVTWTQSDMNLPQQRMPAIYAVDAISFSEASVNSQPLDLTILIGSDL
jgi:hypothetical protein